MIKNGHQLRTAQAARDSLQAALLASNDADGPTYAALIADVQREIDEFVGVRDGYLVDFEVTSIDGLADALVKARISGGKSQRDLADALGVSEQMVQKDEGGGYERASLARLADVADALGFSLKGRLARVDQAESTAQGMTANSTIVSSYQFISMFAVGQAIQAHSSGLFEVFQPSIPTWTWTPRSTGTTSQLSDVVTTLRSQDVA